MNSKDGKEERTRKMARAKIINLPHLPVKLLCKLKREDLIMAGNQSGHNQRGGGAPPWPLSRSKEMKGRNKHRKVYWRGGRTAMAAVPYPVDGLAVRGESTVKNERKDLKRGRTAMAAFPDQVGEPAKAGEYMEEPTKRDMKRGRTAMAAFPDQVDRLAVKEQETTDRDLKRGHTAMAAFPGQVGKLAT